MDRKIAKTVTKTLATAALGGMLVGTVGFVAGGCAKDSGSATGGAGEKHACKGQNACKGQGWVEAASAEECTGKGGTVAQ